MRIRFPQKVDNEISTFKQKVMPRTLFFRTMLLVIVPLIVVQIVSIVAYFDSSWGKVGKRLSDNLSENMAFIVALNEKKAASFEDIRKLALSAYNIDVSYFQNGEKYDGIHDVLKNKMVTGFLQKSLETKFANHKTTIYLPDKKNLAVLVEVPQGVYVFKMPTKTIFNSSVFGFIAWMIGTSFLLFGVSVLFLRKQAKAIRELANFADSFGRGVDMPFKPYGSVEVRTAGVAFNKMKERIKRQMKERMQMLAGVSHDLRTPLTRMKLLLAMDEDMADHQAFLEDVTEMERMLEGYLSFARGEGGEESVKVDMDDLIKETVGKFKMQGMSVEYINQVKVSALLAREQAMKRMLSNIISNACRYGKHVQVSLKESNNRLEITVDDDGPGIPEDKREEVFKAFYRIEESRNKETGGVGLGLAIVKDVACTRRCNQAHGQPYGRLACFNSASFVDENDFRT